MLVLFCICFALLQVSKSYGAQIKVSNGGKWGQWYPMEMCDDGYVAKGFRLKVELPQGSGDDTALNGIRLLCFKQKSVTNEQVISSGVGPYGNWGPDIICPDGYLTKFSLRVEAEQGKGDDTAANNIKFECSGGRMLEGYGLSWGTYGSWSETCPYGINGIMTSVEGAQGDGDDTALNDVWFSCANNLS